MNYVFAPWVPDPESVIEDDVVPQKAGIPDSFSSLLLADGMRMTWGVFQVEGDYDEMKAAGLQFVPRSLDSLLRSGEAYPPALALARDEIERAYRDTEDPDREAFVHKYERALRSHLREQANAGYILLEAIEDEPCYIWAGSFYWVIEYLPSSDEVRWVSTDYFVYRSPARHFALSEGQKEALTRRPCSPSQ